MSHSERAFLEKVEAGVNLLVEHIAPAGYKGTSPEQRVDHAEPMLTALIQMAEVLDDTAVMWAIAHLAEAGREIARLKDGKQWTKEEIHNLCHDLPKTVPVREFNDGCNAEQRKLYGCAPDADRVTYLEQQVKLLREAMQWFASNTPGTPVPDWIDTAQSREPPLSDIKLAVWEAERYGQN